MFPQKPTEIEASRTPLRKKSGKMCCRVRPQADSAPTALNERYFRPECLRRVTRRTTVNYEDQAQGATGAARTRRRGTAARRSRTTASAYPIPSARGDASGQRRRPGLPATSPEGRPRGPVERSRLGQLARDIPLRGRRGRRRGSDRLSLTEGSADHERHCQRSRRPDAESPALGRTDS